MKPFLAIPLLTLVAVGVRAEKAATPPSDATATPPPLGQEISSFGACVSEGHVYVYGGHTGVAHVHSRDNLTADFVRIPLGRADAVWEALPQDEAVQGTALVAWKGLVVRIGGMRATNARGEQAMMFSTDAVRCYDPEARAWSDWPSLPDKVSSHDAVVMDDVLYVAGGWRLDSAAGDKGTWHPHGWSLDLNRRDEGWKDLPPMPAVRRGGSMAAAGGGIWWVGGMADVGGTSNSAFAYDPKAGVWREGPELPGNTWVNAFGSSTFSSGGKLFNSGMDGVIHSLDPAGSEWAATAVGHRHGRIFHRSLPVGDGVFWTIAGASEGGHRSDIEVLPIPAQAPLVANATAWQSFRGGSNNQLADREMARSWSDDSGVAWRVALPGYGQSTPVFGQGGIYVTSSILAEAPEANSGPGGEKAATPAPAPARSAEATAERPASESGAEREGEGESDRGRRRDGKGKGGSMGDLIKEANGPIKTEIAVTRIDPKTGEIAWTAALPSSDPEPSNQYRSNAAPSPCLDERAVYAWFESGDLVALDHAGKTLWHHQVGKKHGLPKGNHGLGGSLVQDRDALYLLVDHDGPSYLLCLDKGTGEARWKIDREKRVSWSTPVVTDDAVIVCSNGVVEEIDKATGERRWIVEGLEGNTVASPLVFRDYVLAPSSKNGQTQLLRRGETDRRVVWKAGGKNTASFSSPVFAHGQIVLVSKAGVAFGLDWRTGEERWSLRLPGGCWATPAVVGSDLYFFSTAGITLVATLTPEGGVQEQHTNELSVGTSKVYGVIPAGGQWIVRTGGEVTAIAKPEQS